MDMGQGGRQHGVGPEMRRIGTYFFWDGALLYAGPGGKSALHAHHLIQIGFAGDLSIKVRTARNEGYVRCRAFILDADVPHQIVCASRSPIYFLWLDPESDRARRLYAARPGLSGQSIWLDATGVDVRGESVPGSCLEAARVRRAILEDIGVSDSREASLDERVHRVTQAIRDSLQDETYAIDELADGVFLSPSRLMHLFREQIGIPIRRYVLWKRVMAAIHHILGGANLTQAALESGFADSAHMSRTFKEMFGVPPSTLFKNSRFVQAIDCSSV